MELYFQNRLLQIAHSHVSRPLVLKYGKQFKAAEGIIVRETDNDHIFHAYETIQIKGQSISMQFTVNTHISACSCDKGLSGATCSHQVAVSTKYKSSIHTNILLPIYQKK